MINLFNSSTVEAIRRFRQNSKADEAYKEKLVDYVTELLIQIGAVADVVLPDYADEEETSLGVATHLVQEGREAQGFKVARQVNMTW